MPPHASHATPAVPRAANQAGVALGLQAYERMVQQMSEPVLLHDVDSRVIAMNAAAEELYGRPANDLLGTTFAQRSRNYVPRNGVRLEQVMQIVHDVGFFRGEAELIRPDGERRVVDASIDAIRGPTGELLGYFSLVRDVTRRTNAEDQANALSTRLMTMLTASKQLLDAATVQQAIDVVARAIAAIGWRSVVVFVYDGDKHPTHVAQVGTPDAELAALLRRAEAGDVHRLLSDATAPYTVSRSYFIPHERALDVFPEHEMVPTPLESDAPYDADWRPLDLAFTPLRLGDGSVIGRFCFARPTDGRRPDADTFSVVEAFADLSGLVIDRLRAQTRKAESDDRAKLLLESLSVVSWEYDPAADRFVYVSPQTEQLNGVSPAQWVDFNSWIDLVHPDDRAVAARFCRDATTRGENHEFEYRMRRRDGDYRWVREVVTVANHPTATGASTRLRGVIVDIHDLKSAERDANRSRGFLEMAQAVADVGSWEVDLRTDQITWSEQVYRVCGVDPDLFHLLDPNIRLLVHPEDRDTHDQWYDELLAGRPSAVEFRIQPRRHPHAAEDAPAERMLRLQAGCEKDDRGRCVRIFGSIQDITSIRRAEAADRRARLLLESMPVVAYEFDIETDCFSYIADAPGTSVGQIASRWTTFRSWLDSIHDDDRDAAAEWCKSVLDAGEGGEITYRVVLDDGTVRWVREIVRVEQNTSGKPIVRGLFVDVHRLKEAEAADERARLILESAPIIAAEFDPTTDRFTYISPQAEKVLGHAVHTLSDLRSWLDAIHPDDRQRVEAWAQSVIDHDLSFSESEYRFITGPGAYRWVREVVTVERKPNGKPVVRLVLVDIHALKTVERAARKAERRAKESEQFLSMSQQLAHLGSWDWDVATGVVTWSNAMYDIFGLDPTEHSQITIDEVNERIHPEDRPMIDNWARQAAPDGSLPPFEHRIVRPSGNVRLTVANARAEFDDDGNLLRLFGTSQDITDIRDMQRRERDKSILLDTVLQHTPGILWRMAADGAFLESRGSGLARLNLSDGQAVGMNAADVYEPGARMLRRVLETGETVSEEHHSVNDDGKPWWFAVTAFPDPSGRGVAGYSFDITEQVLAQRRLEDALKTRGLLLDELDHRVKNTLGGLLTLVDLTAAESTTPEEFAGRIRARIASMATVHSLLSESRWASLKLRSVLTALTPTDAASRVFPRGPEVLIPPTQVTPLAMILQEWMSNALKHGALAGPAGTVHARWHIFTADGERRVTFEWLESGGPPPTSTTPEPGVGTRLVEGFARFELRGDVRMQYQSTGAHHVLELALRDNRHRKSTHDDDATRNDTIQDHASSDHTPDGRAAIIKPFAHHVHHNTADARPIDDLRQPPA